MDRVQTEGQVSAKICTVSVPLLDLVVAAPWGRNDRSSDFEYRSRVPMDNALGSVHLRGLADLVLETDCRAEMPTMSQQA